MENPCLRRCRTTRRPRNPVPPNTATVYSLVAAMAQIRQLRSELLISCVAKKPSVTILWPWRRCTCGWNIRCFGGPLGELLRRWSYGAFLDRCGVVDLLADLV